MKLIDADQSIPAAHPETGFRAAALWYAAQGFTVLPLARFTNRPHRMLGKGNKGKTWPSSDPERVARWWMRDAFANIGIATGSASSLLVIDADRKTGKADGVMCWEAWCIEQGVSLSDVPAVASPTGGMHYWFRLPDGVDSPHRVGWLPGVDAPWQVAVPPSMRRVVYRDIDLSTRGGLSESFEPYRWWNGGPGRLPVAPDLLLAALERSTGSNYQPDGSIVSKGHLPDLEDLRVRGFGIHSGSRNADCLAFARRLWNKYSDERTVVTLVREVFLATDQTKDHPFTWQEAWVCMEQAERYWRADIEQAQATLARWRR